MPFARCLVRPSIKKTRCGRKEAKEGFDYRGEKMSWRDIVRKEEEKMVGAVTTTSPSSVKGKLFNISHGKRRKKRGKEKETEY
tara:strand:+ start:735 stop:983 length:249 start_codon:yes stop_codon:yes gene_type:complete